MAGFGFIPPTPIPYKIHEGHSVFETPKTIEVILVNDPYKVFKHYQCTNIIYEYGLVKIFNKQETNFKNIQDFLIASYPQAKVIIEIK
jgi:hypothetical protein